jgi:hypothetical protein
MYFAENISGWALKMHYSSYLSIGSRDDPATSMDIITITVYSPRPNGGAIQGWDAVCSQNPFIHSTFSMHAQNTLGAAPHVQHETLLMQSPSHILHKLSLMYRRDNERLTGRRDWKVKSGAITFDSVYRMTDVFVWYNPALERATSQ